VRATVTNLCKMFAQIVIRRRCSEANLVPQRTLRGMLVLFLAALISCGGRLNGAGGSSTDGKSDGGSRADSSIDDAGDVENGSGSSTGGDSGSDTSRVDAGPSPCSEGANQCDGLATQVCSGGQWANFGSPCSYACVNGACTGVCNPGAAQCSGSAVETCGANGEWGSPVTCAAPEPFCSQGLCSATAGPPQPLSCQTSGVGLSNCGPNHESCCTSLEVPGGSFFRSYDSVDCQGGTDAGVSYYPEPSCYLSMAYPATVSGFRLDKYEITVGRYRQFVNAVDGGWLPAAGSGKHSYLNGGLGLADSSAPGSFETGWDPSWSIPTTAQQWNGVLEAPFGIYSPTPGPDDNMPINALDWYDAYAFCIWDGGFLPSEAEWNYAVAGGSEQRTYPWSNPPSSQVIDCSHANYLGLADGTVACYPSGLPQPVGSESPLGDGKWGQTDLAGNVLEFVLDRYAPYGATCSDCAYLDAATDAANIQPVLRGGGGIDTALGVLAAVRYIADRGVNQGTTGARCARAP